MAVRRQQQLEAQLKENAILITTIKPIVDEAVAFKAPAPYALREVKRVMDKGTHFRDNTYVKSPTADSRITSILSILACHFRDGVRPPKESSTWGLS